MTSSVPILMRTAVIVGGLCMAAALTGADQPDASPGPVVIELFTSEGCNSCPAAETLIDHLASEDPALVVLQFHVDYWDHLGWRDPYGSATADLRQQRYVRQLGLQGAYTPEAIVQGATDALGSDEPALRASIASARRRLVHAPAVTLEGTLTWNGQRCIASIETHDAPVGAQLTLVVCDGPLTSVIARGENAGRTLTHREVVRATAVGPVAARSEITATLPDGADPAQARAIVLLADREAHIISARRLSLPAAP